MLLGTPWTMQSIGSPKYCFPVNIAENRMNNGNVTWKGRNLVDLNNEMSCKPCSGDGIPSCQYQSSQAWAVLAEAQKSSAWLSDFFKQMCLKSLLLRISLDWYRSEPWSYRALWPGHTELLSLLAGMGQISLTLALISNTISRKKYRAPILGKICSNCKKNVYFSTD